MKQYFVNELRLVLLVMQNRGNGVLLEYAAYAKLAVQHPFCLFSILVVHAIREKTCLLQNAQPSSSSLFQTSNIEIGTFFERSHGVIQGSTGNGPGRGEGIGKGINGTGKGNGLHCVAGGRSGHS